MRPEIHATMSRQRGLVTRGQAVGAGVAPERVDRLVRDGSWTAVRRGVYIETSTWEAVVDYRERRVVLDLAASLRVTSPHVMSHDSAAHLLGLAILRPSRALTHLTRPRLVGTHVRDDVKHHLAPFAPPQVTEVDGIRVLDAARTAADIAREHGDLAGVVAMDSARRLGVGLDELRAAVDPAMRCWPGVTVVRDALERCDGDADSVLETLTREVLVEVGLGVPQAQFGLSDGHRTAWSDFRVGRHLIECDGLVKYHRVEDGGLATVAPEDVVVREKLRQDWLCGFGLGMSRVVWSEVWGGGRAGTVVRLRREILATHRLHGTSIDDLTPFLARGPRPRPGANRM